MHLSRLELNGRSRRVQADLRDCQELHRTVMAAFPQGEESARAEYGVLYRLDLSPREGVARLLVQSAVEPDWSRLPAGYLIAVACKSVEGSYEAVEEGMVLRFRLRANVTKRIKSGSDGTVKKNGRRVLLRGRDEQLDWLVRKGEQFGFHPLQVEMVSEEKDLRAVAAVGWTEGHRGAGQLSFGAVLFEGLLRIEDREKFRKALVVGIGPAKAYGFGMVSVAPARGM